MARVQLNKQELQDVTTAFQRHILSEKRAGRPLNRKTASEVRRQMENSVARRRRSSHNSSHSSHRKGY